MSKTIHLHAIIPEQYQGLRLDQALSKLFPEHSRERLKTWLLSGAITMDGQQCKPKQRVKGGEEIIIQAQTSPQESWEAQDIPLDMVYEDEHILVINKPSGLVAHPAAGHHQGTLANALLHYCPQMAHMPRAGLIHRLDKDTSGLLVMAKTLEAHTALVKQLQERDIERHYLAIIFGKPTGGGTVETQMGRHPLQRKRMAVVQEGKLAVTHYRIKETFRGHTLLNVKLDTGRTHQIRVHMAHIKHPIVGDPVYFGRQKLPKGIGDELKNFLKEFKRQALHAYELKLSHPITHEWMEWQRDPPQDIQRLLTLLREDAKDNS